MPIVPKPTYKYNLSHNLTAAATFLIGLLTLSSTLYGLLHLHRARLVIADTHITLIAGVSLIYLATLLRRGKQNAWVVSVGVYSLLVVRNFRHFIFDDEINRHYVWLLLSNIILPLSVLVALLIWQRNFRVKSSATTFRIALLRAALILSVTFMYGFAGFLLFDKQDFHQEISPLDAAHYTIDQFGLTTNNHPLSHTRRATFFADSLASVSIASLAYVAISFFAPVRFRFYHRRQDYFDATNIVKKNANSSEDFFKLWPTDKAYFFDSSRSVVIAYQVSGGVALSVADPAGPPAACKQLLTEFLELCEVNDWRPAFIHTGGHYHKTYQSAGLEVQKIGEEALVNIEHFRSSVATNKYFRNINNRFNKQNYSFEVLKPPYQDKLISQLKKISNSWLAGPGRTERGFMMGYFDPLYLQQCDIAVVRNPEGNILAFLNQIPTVKPGEANFDFLRSSRESPSNVNDFLMMNFINYLSGLGFERVNMGLSPLLGLTGQSDKKMIDSIFSFVYENADRFYSFQGLARFKTKYEPEWEDRYIVYTGGIPGLGRVFNALLRAMSKGVQEGSAKGK